MKILKKIILIMASLPLVVSQVSAMDNNMHRVKKDPIFDIYKIFRPSGIFRIAKIPKVSNNNIAIKESPAYYYHRHKLGGNVGNNAPTCCRCNEKVIGEYYTVPGLLDGEKLCKSCMRLHVVLQYTVLVGEKVPYYDEKKLNELRTDESFLSSLPIIINEGVKVCDQVKGEVCPICTVDEIDPYTMDYGGCQQCGTKMCVECCENCVRSKFRCPVCRDTSGCVYRITKKRGRTAGLNITNKRIIHAFNKNSKNSFARKYLELLREAKEGLKNFKCYGIPQKKEESSVKKTKPDQ